MSDPDILDRLGNIAENEVTLPLLVQQLQTPFGVVPFVGAGMSAAIFPQWTTFLRRAAKLAGTRRRTDERIAAGQYEEAAEDLIQELTPGRFQDLIEAAYSDLVLNEKKPAGAVTLIPLLSNGPVITTNFDRLLERVFLDGGYPFDMVIGHSKLDLGVRAFERNDQALLKLHGDWSDPGDRVLTASEYNRNYWDPDQPVAPDAPLPKLFTLLGIRPLLFLGCNLAEDRTVRTLKRVADDLKSSRHYAVVQQPMSRSRIRARSRFLASHNIRPIWYPEGEHHRIEPLLKYLSDQIPDAYRRKIRSPGPPAAARTIPTQLTRFIGRSSVLSELRERAGSARLLTLAGAPGVGKTRLAVELTRLLEPRFERYWFVELSQMSEPHLVPQRVATVLGIREQARRPPIESIAEFLGDHHYLIVLDNCEHVREACTALADYLLRACARLAIVATTREILKVAGEDVCWVQPLEQPDSTRPQGMAEIAGIESVALFLDRAGRALTLTEQNAADIARLCDELEGVPLAIELATAQLTSLSVKQLLAHMDERLSLLVGGVGGTVERQWKSLREAIRFSYERLEPKQRTLFQRLAVFSGGWTCDAATTVCGSGLSTHFEMRDLLLDLHARSLIVITEGFEEKRFRMLDSLRQFSAIELEASGERAAIEQKHAAFFVALAEQAAPKLLQQTQSQWMERLGEDADNFRSAMLRSLGSGHVQTALRLVVALWREAEIRGSWREGRERPEHWREGRARLELVLGAPETEAYPELREKALAGLGMLAYRMGDMETAKRRFGESLSTARNLNDKAGMANALNDLGNVAQLEGDLEAACQYYNESLSLERKMGNARAVAVSLFNLGNSARRLGKLGDARALLEESLQSFERDGQVREAAFPLNALARTAIAQNQWNAATAYASRSLAIRRALSDKRGIGESLRTMGMAEFGQGLIDRALPHFSEALELARSVGNKREIANTLEQVARVAIHQRATATAVALYAAAGRIRDEGDVRLAPAERIEPAEHLAAARAALGDSEFDVHQQAGRAMNAEDWCQAISSLESAPFGARLPSA